MKASPWRIQEDIANYRAWSRRAPPPAGGHAHRRGGRRCPLGPRRLPAGYDGTPVAVVLRAAPGASAESATSHGSGQAAIERGDARVRERDRYPHGVPCWIDTAQPDPEAAARFYGELFGWTLTDQ